MQAAEVEQQPPVVASLPPSPSRVGYLMSTYAGLKVLELMLDVIVLMLASQNCWGGGPWIAFSVTVCLNGTLFFFFLHYIGIADQFKQDTATSIEFISYVCFTVTYFLDAIVLACAGGWYVSNSIGAVFAFIGVLVYLIDTIFLLYSYRRERAEQSVANGLANSTEAKSTVQPSFGHTNGACEYVNETKVLPAEFDQAPATPKGLDSSV